MGVYNFVTELKKDSHYLKIQNFDPTFEFFRLTHFHR